jgi:hypothetical protein
MIRVARSAQRSLGAVVAIALAAGAAPSTGCAFAVRHPAVAAGVVGTTLAFGTCKLASDGYGTCALVGGGAGAFLALVAAAATWLGGDGHTILIEDQAQPIPDDAAPRKRRPPQPVDQPVEPVDPASPAPASPAPASPGSPVIDDHPP